MIPRRCLATPQECTGSSRQVEWSSYRKPQNFTPQGKLYNADRGREAAD